MTIFGKRLSEYAGFAKFFLILIVAVGVARLALSLAGVPSSIDRWFSITVVYVIGVIYYSVRIHTSGFGSYKQILPVNALLSLAGQAVVIAAILIAAISGTDNIFSAPEFSGAFYGRPLVHISGHLIVGVIGFPLVGWLIGAIIMFVVKKVAPGEKGYASAAKA